MSVARKGRLGINNIDAAKNCREFRVRGVPDFLLFRSESLGIRRGGVVWHGSACILIMGDHQTEIEKTNLTE